MMTEDSVFIGIDTSNYTTSVALADADGRILANEKQLLAVDQGQRGLRQSDALFAHTRNLPELMERLREKLHPKGLTSLSVAAIGFSASPRRMSGSYMPCFLAGKATASAMSAVTGTPAYTFSHQEGHVMAALYSAGMSDLPLEQEWIAFHVSGGTTDVMRVIPDTTGLAVELLGQSLDLHAGQAVDRIGVAMGLTFPCGRELERLSDAYVPGLFPMPKPKICTEGMNCHLSGLENLAMALYRKTGDRYLTARYTLDFLADTLIAMAHVAAGRYPDLPILFAGGVMSNRHLQTRIAQEIGKRAYFSEAVFSSDNAAGIALLCRRQYLNTEK